MAFACSRFVRLAGPLSTALALVWTSSAGAQWTPLDPATQPKFVYDLPIPVDYSPDTTMFPGFDYYEIKVAPVTHPPVAFPQTLADGTPIAAPPPGQQWLGLVHPTAPTTPLYTPVWGYGQVNSGGGPLGGRATYPAMSFRSTPNSDGTRNPVKVKWINNLPDNHLFCPAPHDTTRPCAIDRTLMGVLGPRVNHPDDPGIMIGTGQSPDNAHVIHLHGGEIPPDSDGFAELWIGNENTSRAYPRTEIEPPLHGLPAANGIPSDGDYPGGLYETGDAYPGLVHDPAIDPANAGTSVYNAAAAGVFAAGDSVSYQKGQLLRPTGNSVVYNYPMVQQPAVIWYHDHALGKTRINVAAGPAGFFIIDGGAAEDAALAFDRGDCSTAGVLAGRCFDVPVVFQDRAFNHDGTINFPNGLGQTFPGVDPLAPGPNPLVHPQWVPEYFGDMSVVNGVIWPRLRVEQRPYRFRMLNGSNARCYTFALKAPGKVVPLFFAVGTDQGLMRKHAKLPVFTLCPGERQDVIIDFNAFLVGTKVQVTNTAGAPYPNGITPQQPRSPFAHLANLMQFEVISAVSGYPVGPWKPPKLDFGTAPSLPAPVVTRQFLLNEVLDPVTLAPLRVEIDGKAFEDAITETPKRGTVERWNIVNTTVDAHPMHLHLVKFRVVSRQTVDVAKLSKAIGLTTLRDPYGPTWPQINLNFVLANYLMGAPRPPDPNEAGWKDTARSLPGEVLTIEAMWDGSWQDQPVLDADGHFDPTKPFWEPVTAGPYVWHCHIVDHEDNQMMRPVLVLP